MFDGKKTNMNQFCECEKDGWCPRYQREFGGRMREICAGINCDLGTAAAFREQWRMEADTTPPDHFVLPTRRLLLKTDQAPGDTVAMTAAIYSLHKAYPGKYLTAVESPHPEVFAHNPNVVDATTIPNALPLHMHYPAIHQSNDRGIHFMQGWCEFLGMALGISVPLLTNRPHLYFKFDLEDDLSQYWAKDYWLVCSGGKNDFTNKQWHGYQEVVSSLKGRVWFVQVGSLDHNHPRLLGVKDMLGRTTLRQLFDMVRRCKGVLCGVSLLMHVAAALEKPAIVVAGGREPRQWNCYPKQEYVSTVGALPCTSVQGQIGVACWRSRVVPLGDGTILDKDTCQRPTNGIPECMTLIKPEEVATLILRYNMS